MSIHFSVLASGSSGNASLLEVHGFGVLLDLGLGPRQLAGRLEMIGSSWNQVHAALLTHTHGDHWNERTLGQLRRRGIPLFCHADHQEQLKEFSAAFAGMLVDKLVHAYEEGRDLHLSSQLCCRPIGVSHDAGATCAFRFDGAPDFLGQSWALGYAADLGTWNEPLADFFANVDVLALEFNHDVGLEMNSGRSPELIARVLGEAGHLSNDQAAGLVRAILDRSEPGRLRHLVQIHLSRECNRPELAWMVARDALTGWEGIEIHTARQQQAGPRLALRHGRMGKARPERTPRRPIKKTPAFLQPLLPGWEE